MSPRASMWAKQQRVGATGPKLLLVMMADEADSLGHVFGYTVRGGQWNYGPKYYQELCECGETALKTWIKKLREDGFIQLLEQGDRHGNRNKYRLQIPDDFALDLAKNAKSIPPVKGGSDSDLPVDLTSNLPSDAPVDVGGSDSDLGREATALGADSDPKVGQIPTPSLLFTLLDPSVNTPTASPVAPPPVVNAADFVLTDESTVGDLPTADVKDFLPDYLQRNWPFSHQPFPAWLPVLAFARWADSRGCKGSRIQPSQLQGMWRDIESYAAAAGVTRAEYVQRLESVAPRNLCQFSADQFLSNQKPQQGAGDAGSNYFGKEGRGFLDYSDVPDIDA